MEIDDRQEERHLTTIDVDGRRYNVSVEVTFDGVEFVGGLWFRDEAWDDDDGIRDYGVISGRTAEEVVAHALALSEAEFLKRYRRAWAHKRRYHGLRRATEEVLSHIRYLNQVATSMRAGLLDMESAAAEIDVTEQRLHDLVSKLRQVAGIEEEM